MRDRKPNYSEIVMAAIEWAVVILLIMMIVMNYK